ncbi:MAG: hypothetical protein Q8P75_03620 [bacterium]|nr:hypothetical protein [bacterium]
MRFSKTIGHQKQKDIFQHLALGQNLAHAYALAGPENIGKTTFAVDLAEALGVNPILDLFVFDSESGLLIEDARTLQLRLTRTAAASRYKAAVVTYAEKMTGEAASALLKILEEPPRDSIIFLTTTNFYSLLPTVSSRVQRINFGLSSKKEIEEGLEEFGLEPQRSSEIVDNACGRIGLARRIASSEESYNFAKTAVAYYQTLKNGTLVDRLQTADKLAAMESLDIEKFLGFAMRKWVTDEENLLLGKKLQQTYFDLHFNLNAKLLTTNLFI